MYVYENKAHEICIVLDGVVPTETPDFVLKLDKAARQLVVNGNVIDAANAPVATAESVAEPVNEELPEEPVAPAVDPEDTEDEEA